MTVDELISRIVPLLAGEVFDFASRLRTESPLFRLKLWYYDTCAPCCYLQADGITVADRDEILRYDGINAGDNLWDASGKIEFSVGDLGEGEPDTPSKNLMIKAYELMAMDGNELEAAGLDSDTCEEMSRLIAQSLSRRLNATDWTDVCQTSDDFIVYAQNGTDYGCDCYEDLVASVPEEKLNLLRSRGFLGPGQHYDSVSADEEERPARVWVNSNEVHGAEKNVENFLKMLKAHYSCVKKADYIARGPRLFVVTLYHDDVVESDVIERIASESQVDVGKSVPRTDIWG